MLSYATKGTLYCEFLWGWGYNHSSHWTDSLTNCGCAQNVDVEIYRHRLPDNRSIYTVLPVTICIFVIFDHCFCNMCSLFGFILAISSYSYWGPHKNTQYRKDRTEWQVQKTDQIKLNLVDNKLQPR